MRISNLYLFLGRKPGKMNRRKKSITDMEALKAFLRSQKLKATPQRLMVHEAMMELGHASADMVADYISGNCNTKITIASVYNVLSMMADLKIYSRRMSGNNKMYFDVNSFKHIHIYDTTSNSYKDLIDDELLEMVEQRLQGRQPKGYKLESIDIQLICRPARKTRKKKAAL